MNRNPRPFAKAFAAINTDSVIVPRIDRYSVWMGETFSMGLALAAGGAALPATELRWQTEGASGTLTVPPCPALGVAETAGLAFTAPADGANRMLAIHLEWRAGDRIIATDQVDIALYARPDTAGLPSVHSADPALSRHLAALGLTIAPQGQADVTVTRSLDAADIDTLQKGAKYLVLADGSGGPRLRRDMARREQPFIPIVDETPGLPGNPESQLPNMVLHARQGTIWRGDWIAGFSWLHRNGPLGAIPGGPLVDLSFDRVIPHHVLTGFRTWEYGGPVHAGLVVGWCHKPAALIAERRIGLGNMVASTFRLCTEAPNLDPVATTLMFALLRLAARPV